MSSEHKDSNAHIKKKETVFLSLCNGMGKFLEENLSDNIPNKYGFVLRNDKTRHTGQENKQLSPPIVLYEIYHTHNDKERADQLIQFFNDPTVRIGFDFGGEGITGTLYWFNKYRENPETYVQQRIAEGSQISYFPIRSETDWIDDNKTILVASDSEELGPYCHSSGIANVIHSLPHIREHESEEILKRIIDALYSGESFILEGTGVAFVAGKPIVEPITCDIDVASSRMMANQDRTAIGAFQRHNGYKEAVVTELYNLRDNFIGDTASLELMTEKMKAAKILAVNDDYIKEVGTKTLEELSRRYPNLTIINANFSPSHGYPFYYKVGFPCLYGGHVTINPDGRYTALFKSEGLASKKERNAEYHKFLSEYNICKDRAPKVTESSSYRTSLVDYLKDWHNKEAVNLMGKDVVFDYRIANPIVWGHAYDNRNLGNLLQAGALQEIRSLTLNLRFDTTFWDRKNENRLDMQMLVSKSTTPQQQTLSESNLDKFDKFHEQYPTYEDFIERHPLFHDPESHLIKRVDELAKDYGIKMKLSTEIKGKEVVIYVPGNVAKAQIEKIWIEKITSSTLQGSKEV